MYSSIRQLGYADGKPARFLVGKTSVLVGQSGVGKSSPYPGPFAR